MINLALMAEITLCHSIEMKSLFTRFRWKINSFLLSLKPPYENLQDSLADDNKLQPADNDTLISRWKTPVSPAYFKASFYLLSWRVFDSKDNIWSDPLPFFFFF